MNTFLKLNFGTSTVIWARESHPVNTLTGHSANVHELLEVYNPI